MNDLLVIGGGPGGYAAAIRGSQLGAKTVLVEAGDMGGVCVNRGCIPSKIWHRAAYLLNALKSAGDFGVRATLDGLDFSALRDRKNGVANDIRMGMEALCANNGIEVIRGRALLKGPGRAVVGDQSIEAQKIILATGGVLDIPDIPGLEDAALSTDQALELTEMPETILVWGAGPIQVEMAVFFKMFGSKVILACKEPGILPKEDQTTGQRVAKCMRDMEIEVLPRYDLKQVNKVNSSFEAVLSGAEEKIVTIDRVLIGDRKPNVANLGLDQAGIKLTPDGAIQVDDHLMTSARGIYAVGDCIGGFMLSHASSAMAVTAAENARGRDKKFPFHLIPRSIWTIPEVGSVGLSEEEAEELDYEVETGAFPYAINGLAMSRGELDGDVKIVFDSKYGEILGVHIVGANATELIGEAVTAMQLECTVGELAASIRAHPTFSEAVVDAARDALNWALYLPKQ